MTNITKEENQISEKLNISKIPLNVTGFYSLNKEQDWVKTLLLELNEKAESNSPEKNLASTELTISLEVTKSFKPEYNEYLLIRGHITADYITICVRTLEEMNERLELSFNSCFLHERFEKDEAFAEQLEIFEKDEMYELYFYSKGVIELARMIHEVIYLNINQYPIKDETSPLPWAKSETDTEQ